MNAQQSGISFQLQAKRDGLLTQVRPLTERLVRSGIYLDQSLINRALARVAE